MTSKRKGQMGITRMVDSATSAFVTLAISGIVVAVVLFDVGESIVAGGEVNSSAFTANASDYTLLDSLQTDVEDGMVQLVGLVILLVVIVILGFLRQRA